MTYFSKLKMVCTESAAPCIIYYVCTYVCLCVCLSRNIVRIAIISRQALTECSLSREHRYCLQAGKELLNWIFRNLML